MNARQSEIEFRFLAEPTHVNFGGKVHGGMVMKWMDQAGYACAAGWSGKYCVTVSVGAIRFYRPLLVGNLVSVHARVALTGTTSVHIYISVKAGDPREQKLVETNHCIMTFVAMDEAGYPVSVPNWQPETDGDRCLEDYAKKMKETSQAIESEFRCRLEL